MYSFGELPWKQSKSSSGTTEPVLEAGLSERHVVSVAAGASHNGAVTEDGAVHMWGDNTYGQCGLSGLSVVPNPTPVGVVDCEATPPQPVRILEVACGEQHTLALSAQHEVWSWGSGCQLGLLTTSFPVWKPQKVEHLAGRHVLQVVCGASHSLALVRCLPPPHEARRQPVDKCGQCNQSLYTMTDKEDHVIISDSHYCPLGVELEEGESKSGSEGSSGHSKMRISPSEPILSAHIQTAKTATPSRSAACPVSAPASVSESHDLTQCNQSAPKDPEETQVSVSYGEVSEAAPETHVPETYNAKASGGSTATGVKSSPYPDEQALNDYLKKLSDQTLAEHASKNPTTTQCAQVSDVL